jgi:hypothetical protein
MKWESKQRVKKSQPDFRKTRVHATQTKKMVLVFFNAKGLTCKNHVPKGKTVNAEYVKKADQVVPGLCPTLGQWPS